MRITATITALALLCLSNTTKAQIAFSEDFESVTTPALPMDWQNVKTGTPKGWASRSGAATSANDWKCPAHTNYVMVDDWNNAADINNPSSLVTPIIDMAALATPYLHFDYYFVSARTGSITETFTVQTSVDSGKNWTTLKAITAGNPYEWLRADIDLSAFIGEDSLMISFAYSDKGAKIIGVALDNIKVYDPPANDIALTAITPKVGSFNEYGTVSTNKPLGGTVFNNGSTAITGYTIYYQMGANPVVTNTYTGTNIAPFTSTTFTATTPLALPSAVGANDVKVWAELTGDTNPLNDSNATNITAVSYMPTKKILAEEGTGTWCGWCPRGAVYMDSIAHSDANSSFSLVAVHNGDPMTVGSYDSKIGALIGGYPSMTIDRRQEVDPSAMFGVYDEQKDYFGFADITLTDVPAQGFNYSLKVSVKPSLDMSGDYRLALVLTEDDVKGEGSTWGQANYYSFQSQNLPLSGAGHNWQSEPSKIPAENMSYDHVGRGIWPGPDGAAGSLPATMTAGSTYDYTFNVAMQPSWHRYANLMHAVVMLIRNSDGFVLNSNNLTVPVGIKDVNAGIEGFKVFPNPAANKAYVGFSLTEQSDVNVIVTDAVGRTITTIEKNDFETGNHRLDIDLSAFTSGIYNVTLQTDNGQVSTRLSVIK